MGTPAAVTRTPSANEITIAAVYFMAITMHQKSGLRHLLCSCFSNMGFLDRKVVPVDQSDDALGDFLSESDIETAEGPPSRRRGRSGHALSVAAACTVIA